MTKETDLLAYNDVLCDLASLITQHGARQVMLEFRSFYPDLFSELAIQIARIPDEKKIPALLKRK